MTELCVGTVVIMCMATLLAIVVPLDTAPLVLMVGMFAAPQVERLCIMYRVRRGLEP